MCKSCEHEIVCHSKNQNKNNFKYTTLTKHVNNQTNCSNALEILKKIWICLVIISFTLCIRSFTSFIVVITFLNMTYNLKAWTL